VGKEDLDNYYIGPGLVAAKNKIGRVNVLAIEENAFDTFDTSLVFYP